MQKTTMTEAELKTLKNLAEIIDVYEKDLFVLDKKLELAKKVYDVTELKNLVKQHEALKSNISKKLKDYYRLRQKFEKATTDMPSNLKKVLALRYIEFMAWGGIEKKMHYSQSQLFRLHSDALGMISGDDATT